MTQRRLRDCEIPAVIVGAFERAGVFTLEDYWEMDARDLLRLRGMGRKRLEWMWEHYPKPAQVPETAR